MRGSREISLVPSLHRASTDALIMRMRAFSRKNGRLYARPHNGGSAEYVTAFSGRTDAP